VPGLFAAGELTGVAGINGSHGGSGTFLAPSVLMGRIAGRGAAQYAARLTLDSGAFPSVANSTDRATADEPPRAPVEILAERVRDGYVHFDEAHRVVSARNYACDYCHSGDWSIGPALSITAQLKQLESCTSCH